MDVARCENLFRLDRADLGIRDLLLLPPRLPHHAHRTTTPGMATPTGSFPER